jgi:carbonic anhydrase
MKKYEAMVLSCIDPRFQPKIFQYLKRRKLLGKYSYYSVAGAAVGVTHKNFKSWQKTFIDNLSTSIHLHKIKKLIVMNHKDCGAAKLVNEKKQFSEKNEEKIHDMSFQKLKKIINRKFPKLDYEFYLMNLNSSVQKF